jgi:hypothetical protein
MPAAFPNLKTGAIIQYPATKNTQHSSFVVRFLDGSDQRYRNYAAPLHRWNIRLNLLDEAELRVLEQFFAAQEGRFGVFSFVDPWTQTIFPNCSFDQDNLEYQLSGEAHGTTDLVVVENRV